MIKTNRDKLVKVSVIGEVVSPVIGDAIYKVTAGGEPVVLPGVGGITYNIRVGDLACGWMADHVEPGVSLENRVSDSPVSQRPEQCIERPRLYWKRGHRC